MAYELAKQFLREAGIEECVDALLLEELQKVLSGEFPILCGLPEVPAKAKVLGYLDASESKLLVHVSDESLFDFFQRHVEARITDREGLGFIICEGGAIVEVPLPRARVFVFLG